MAESVNHRKALDTAWERYRATSEHDVYSPVPTIEFEAGYDALLNEIRPLVADLKLTSEYDHRDSIGQQVSERLKHADAVKRLRELVLEGNDK